MDPVVMWQRIWWGRGDDGNGLRWSMDRIAALEKRIEKSRLQSKADQNLLANLKKKRDSKVELKARRQDTHMKIILGSVILKFLECGMDETERDTDDMAFMKRVKDLLEAGLTSRDRTFIATTMNGRRDDGQGKTASSKPATSTSKPATPKERA